MMKNEFYPLTISEVKTLTKDAVSLSFHLTKDIYETFNWYPGQYLTLKFNINGSEERRSYSICSSPYSKEAITVAVKRVQGGLISNYINDNINVGDVIDVLPPSGNFYASIQKENYKSYYLFAAGSGITPILSILQSALIEEPNSHVYLMYGNRDRDSVMFHDKLLEIQNAYSERFVMVHHLSKPKSSWSDLWKTKDEKGFRKGRIDSKSIHSFIDEFPPYAQNTAYFICGPAEMILSTKEALKSIDVPENRIKIEYFGTPSNSDSIQGIENASLKATLRGKKVQTHIEKGSTILRALIKEGKNPPYSCEGGVCSTCVCKLVKGKVHMKNNLSLDEKDVANGLILSCQSIPLSDEIEVEYQ